jgi:malate dehydrogenase (oxaloacetate-decarboxylating)
MPAQAATSAHADETIRTALTGYDLLNDPRLNKGTAFTEEERDAFALHGLLPPHIGTLYDQISRRKNALQIRQPHSPSTRSYAICKTRMRRFSTG